MLVAATRARPFVKTGDTSASLPRIHICTPFHNKLLIDLSAQNWQKNNMESNKEDFVDLLIFFSLWCRDPLVTAKLPIAKGEVTYEIYSTEITYTEFEILINEDIEKLKSGPWNFIEWHRYNLLPVEIKLCTYAEGRLRPTERLLTTTEDIKNALSFIMDVRGPEHFAVKVTMYEGDEPPADPGLYEEEVDPSTASVHHRDVCEICGRRHGVGKCILAHGGIKIISGEDSLFGSGDENGTALGRVEIGIRL
jgi:hypothetical protein